MIIDPRSVKLQNGLINLDACDLHHLGILEPSPEVIIIVTCHTSLVMSHVVMLTSCHTLMSDLAGREFSTAAPDMVTTYIMGTGGGYLCSGHCCLHGAYSGDLTAVIGSHGNI